ncbi:MAG: DEAD/DEAH box helicase [Ignisphaera sp.]
MMEVLGEDDIKRLLNAVGFYSPTLVQKIAIPRILNHELDIIIVAPTGSGKTEAAILPLMYKLTLKDVNNNSGVKILYITPLRALNRDIYRRIERIASIFKLNVDVWHGDTSPSARKRVLKNPPNILITTPESLQILLIKERMRDSFRSLYAVVVDEAQDILPNERGTELVVALERLDEIVGRHVRRLLISSPLGNVDSIAHYFFSGRRYDVVYVKGSKEYDIEVLVSDNSYNDGEFDVDNVVAFLCNNILGNEAPRQVLLFANTRVTAEELGYSLSKCLDKDVIALHHSSLSRDIRELVEEMFKKGDLRIVVATSSLELGIDVGGVDMVIQYMSPRQALKLVQRVGRAGHREQAVSKGVIVVPPLVTELMESLIIARRAMRGFLERLNYHIAPLDVLAHQIVGIILERGHANIEEIWRIITKATPFNSITLSQIEAVVDFLNTIGIIKCENRECMYTKRGLIYYVSTNMIPDTNHYEAKSLLDRKTVGFLDEEFALTCNEDDVIVLAGKLWRVVGVDVENREVVVLPIESSDQEILPKWVGETIPVHRNVAREVCAFARRFCTCDTDICVDRLMDEYRASEIVREFFKKNREKICRIYPRDDTIVVEVFRMQRENKSLLAFYTCLGTKASEAFSILLEYLVKYELGVSVAYKSHQLGTVLFVNSLLSKNDLIKIFKKLHQIARAPDEVTEIIKNVVKNSSLFKWRLVSVAKKLGIIGKEVEAINVKRIIEGLSNIDIVVSEALRELYLDKIDIDELLRFLQNIAKGKIKVKIIISSKASPFIEEIAALSVFRTLVKYSILPRETMIEIVKRRLLETEIKLFCTSCYNTWSINLKERLSSCSSLFSCSIVCPYCGSMVITLVNQADETRLLKKVFEKLRRSSYEDVKFLQIEKEILDKHRKLVDFIMSHGVAGVIALQGIGIGIETAKRIIAKSSDLDTLIMNIVDQEKTFLRTARYWRK